MTAQRVLDVARSQLGTVESPPNSNRTKYGRAYGMDGAAWCAMFCWWVFREAGHENLLPKSAYTPAIADWFNDRHQWGSAPRPGALVLFDFPNDGVNRISHIGIVEAVGSNGSIISIEGNTSGGTSGSQRDGGGVYRRTRKAGIVGYAYPAYPNSPASVAATSPAPPDTEDDPMTPIEITVYQDHSFRGAAICEAGKSSSVIGQAWVPFGVTWGAADVIISFLGDDGLVIGQQKRGHVVNNRRLVVDVPDGAVMVTVEGVVTTGAVPAAAVITRRK